MTEPTNLRALLGDRYDETRRVALRALLTAELHGDPGEGVVDLLIDCGPRSDYVLAAVLPNLLATAWDEGYEAAAGDFHDDEFGLPGDPTPNPYRTEETR